MPEASSTPIDEASRPGGPGGPDRACLLDGYVFDPVSGFHWHPRAAHWHQPALGIFLDADGALLDAAAARSAARSAGADSTEEDALDVMEIGPSRAEEEADDDLPALSVEEADATWEASNAPAVAGAEPSPALVDAAGVGLEAEPSAWPQAELEAVPTAAPVAWDAAGFEQAAVPLAAPVGWVPSSTLAADAVPDVVEEDLVEHPGDPAVAALPLASPEPGTLDPATLPTSFEDAWRVIVHLRTGAAKRGELNGADLLSPTVLLHHAGGSGFIDTASIKAIFFMGEAHMPVLRPTGRRVRITLADGRVLEGMAPQKVPATGGFYVLPLDARTNTARIFVFPHAIKDLAFA